MPPTNETNFVSLKVRFDDLTGRANAAAQSLQATIPLTGRPLKAQESFILALADMQLLQQLCKTAQKTFNGVNLEALSPEQLKGADEMTSVLAELAQELVETMVENFGVCKEVVMPACIKDLGRQIDLIESIVVRMEGSLAEVVA